MATFCFTFCFSMFLVFRSEIFELKPRVEMARTFVAVEYRKCMEEASAVDISCALRTMELARLDDSLDLSVVKIELKKLIKNHYVGLQ